MNSCTQEKPWLCTMTAISSVHPANVSAVPCIVSCLPEQGYLEGFVSILSSCILISMPDCGKTEPLSLIMEYKRFRPRQAHWPSIAPVNHSQMFLSLPPPRAKRLTLGSLSNGLRGCHWDFELNRCHVPRAHPNLKARTCLFCSPNLQTSVAILL